MFCEKSFSPPPPRTYAELAFTWMLFIEHSSWEMTWTYEKPLSIVTASWDYWILGDFDHWAKQQEVIKIYYSSYIMCTSCCEIGASLLHWSALFHYAAPMGRSMYRFSLPWWDNLIWSGSPNSKSWNSNFSKNLLCCGSNNAFEFRPNSWRTKDDRLHREFRHSFIVSGVVNRLYKESPDHCKPENATLESVAWLIFLLCVRNVSERKLRS